MADIALVARSNSTAAAATDNLHGAIEVLVAILFGMPLLAMGAAYLYGWSLLSTKSKTGMQVPRGAPWQWPLIGETFTILLDADKFVASRVKRYGETFTSHLFAASTVVITGADSMRFVLASQQQKLFGPSGVTRILGLEGLNQAAIGTPLHSLVRRITLQRVKGENVAGLVPDIDRLATSAVNSWAEQDTVSVFTELMKYTFYVAIRSIFGDMDPSLTEMEIFREQFAILVKGIFSLKFDFPGTAYNKALKALKVVHDLIDTRVAQRKSDLARGNKHEDILEDLMTKSMSGPEDVPLVLTPSQLRDNVLLLLLASNTTTASGITWLIKYLYENPDELQEVIVEHSAIVDSKDSKDYILTYEDTLKMPASTRAFMEANRLMCPPLITRTALQDIDLNGQLIPKGWTIQLGLRPTHYNPQYYSDPHKFNPSRFKVTPQPGTFLAFGFGPRLCPGNDLAKIQAVVLLHRLVLNNRLEVLGDDELDRWMPTPIPRGGYPIRVTRIK